MAEVSDPPREATIFQALRPETVEFLLGRVTTVRVAPGVALVREHEPGGDLFFLCSGRVEVVKERTSPSGEHLRLRLAELGPGDCIGEASFLGVLPRNASVVALEDSVAARLDRRVLLDLYERDPREYALFVMNLARETARRLWSANERLLDCVPDALLVER